MKLIDFDLNLLNNMSINTTDIFISKANVFLNQIKKKYYEKAFSDRTQHQAFFTAIHDMYEFVFYERKSHVNRCPDICEKLLILEIQYALKVIKYAYLNWETFYIATDLFNKYHYFFQHSSLSVPLSEQLEYGIDEASRKKNWTFFIMKFISTLIQNDVTSPIAYSSGKIFFLFFDEYKKNNQYPEEQIRALINIKCAALLFYGEYEEKNLPEGIMQLNHGDIQDNVKSQIRLMLRETSQFYQRYISDRNNPDEQIFLRTDFNHMKNVYHAFIPDSIQKYFIPYFSPSDY